jgi:hypothetical protein
MPSRTGVTVRPILDVDIPDVARFLADTLAARGGEDRWVAAMSPSWDSRQPNHGYMLVDDDRPVGVHLALYSERIIDGRREEMCNLAAWCVLPSYRHHGLRLLRALLRQEGYHFTDFSPSGNVVPLNLRLGFTALDTATALSPNVPWPPPSAGVRIATDPDEVPQLLSDGDLEIFRDHARAAAANHLVVVRGDETCYVIYRRDRRKGLPLFASFLHVSNPSLFQVTGGHVRRHLLLRRGIPFTLSELRIVGSRPRLSIMLSAPRPKMYRSPTLRAVDIDYLYSELTCVAW